MSIFVSLQRLPKETQLHTKLKYILSTTLEPLGGRAAGPPSTCEAPGLAAPSGVRVGEGRRQLVRGAGDLGPVGTPGELWERPGLAPCSQGAPLPMRTRGAGPSQGPAECGVQSLGAGPRTRTGTRGMGCRRVHTLGWTRTHMSMVGFFCATEKSQFCFFLDCPVSTFL